MHECHFKTNLQYHEWRTVFILNRFTYTGCSGLLSISVFNVEKFSWACWLNKHNDWPRKAEYCTKGPSFQHSNTI